MPEFKTVNAEELPLNKKVRVIEANEDGLVALDKPAGLMSHPNKDGETGRSLLLAEYNYADEFFFWKNDRGEDCRAWLVNRLDSPTSGVILLALQPEINRTIKEIFATHRVEKTYYALVRHRPKAKIGTWSDTLLKQHYDPGRRLTGGRPVKAKTTYRAKGSPTGGFPVCLLQLNPITGRTHQLRVQCSKHGHPIVGDRTYGHFGFNKEVVLETGEKRMMLHSSSTVINYAFHGKPRRFIAESPLPKRFKTVIDFRPGLSQGSHVIEPAPRAEDEVLSRRRFKGS